MSKERLYFENRENCLNYINSCESFVEIYVDAIENIYLSSMNCLEVGSGPGLDGKELQRRGVDMQLTDASEQFVSIVDGLTKMDAFEITGKYDMITMNKIMNDYSLEDIEKMSKSIDNALNVDGIFVTTLWTKDIDNWDRYENILRRNFTLIDTIQYTEFNDGFDSILCVFSKI